MVVNNELYAELGNKIIQAVGLPLVNGTPEELAYSVAMLQIQLIDNPKKLNRDAAERLKKIDLIMHHRRELERLIDNFPLFIGKESIQLIMKETYKTIDKSFYTPDSRKSMPERIAIYNEGCFPLWPVHFFLDKYFRDFFGKKPAYTYSELKGYTGPFWNFVQAAHDILGVNVSQSRVAKANTRSKKKTK